MSVVGVATVDPFNKVRRTAIIQRLTAAVAIVAAGMAAWMLSDGSVAWTLAAVVATLIAAIAIITLFDRFFQDPYVVAAVVYHKWQLAERNGQGKLAELYMAACLDALARDPSKTELKINAYSRAAAASLAEEDHAMALYRKLAAVDVCIEIGQLDSAKALLQEYASIDAVAKRKEPDTDFSAQTERALWLQCQYLDRAGGVTARREAYDLYLQTVSPGEGSFAAAKAARAALD